MVAHRGSASRIRIREGDIERNMAETRGSVRDTGCQRDGSEFERLAGQRGLGRSRG
jgi:hypothetical protein